MTLLALQRRFKAHLVGDEPGIAGHAIYHNAYRVQLSDCLTETFAQTCAWIGGHAFADAAKAHVARTPPSGWTLDAYGAGFDATLASLYPDDPEVAELATLEWLLSRAFAGANATPLSVATIATTDWDHAGLRFVPTIHLADVRTNAGAIWSALSADAMPPPATILPARAALLVWRQGFTPCFRVIEADEADALALMRAGSGFAMLCNRLVEAHGEEQGVARAGAMLGQWFNDGLIAAVHDEEQSCA